MNSSAGELAHPEERHASTGSVCTVRHRGSPLNPGDPGMSSDVDRTNDFVNRQIAALERLLPLFSLVPFDTLNS
jgi:hypothetical protein